jgi:RpiB/LacA/LacB family sugar-phosphate isomerase
VLDLGAQSTAPYDYPDAAEAVASALRAGEADRGIIVCGSGAGVSIAANKFPGIRAAVCHDTYTAHQAVEHDDDMNVLCLGGPHRRQRARPRHRSYLCRGQVLQRAAAPAAPRQDAGNRGAPHERD